MTTATGDILIVDDTPANLRVLGAMLRAEGYRVRPAPSGPLALQAARAATPDLVLLDIMMPEMDGFETCEQLQAIPQMKGVPILFLSALSDPANKVKAFQAGGVDYITKPFQVEEVEARVRLHLEMSRLRRAERRLLDDTLKGAIEVLTDVLSLMAPEVFKRSRAARKLCRQVAEDMQHPDPWQVEAAALLSNLGLVGVSPGVVVRLGQGVALTPDEQEELRGAPRVAQRILQRVPRLDSVAAIVGRQDGDHRAASNTRERVPLGAGILQLALHLEARVARGEAPHLALGALEATGRYDPVLVDFFAQRVPTIRDEILEVSPQELKVGMYLLADVRLDSGALLVTGERELDPVLLERISNFAHKNRVQGPVRVRVQVVVER
ncbi:MAG: response regulator [Deltaproteobacteria bacterium]|nr:response regulator [Deltaproteobacteria bacterium]